MDKPQVLVLLASLVEKTNQNKCHWEEGGNEYKLYLKSGVISFKYDYLYDVSVDQFSFVLSLYNASEKFASYYVDFEENYDKDLYSSMNALRIAIKEWKEQIINGKMSVLIDEINQF